MVRAGDVTARAQAAAELRRRREATIDEELELVSFFRKWATALYPMYADSIAALPDAAFRPTQYRNADGRGQDPDELRRQFLELVEKHEQREERS